MAAWGQIRTTTCSGFTTCWSRVSEGVRRQEVAVGDRFAKALRGFGLVGLLATVVIVLAGHIAGAAMVFAWAWYSRTPWSALGLSRPRNWIQTLAVGIPTGVAFKLLMKAIVMPLLGAPPINPAYQFLTGNRAALPGMLLAVVVGGGFGEELIWRGFLFERLGQLLRQRAGASAAIVLITAVLFGLAHYPDQGIPGATQAAIVGVGLGTLLLVSGRLWLPIIVHAAFDVTAVLMIYWNLEEAVAHVIFR